MLMKKVSLSYKGIQIDGDVRQSIDHDGNLYNIVDSVFFVKNPGFNEKIAGETSLRIACHACFSCDGDVIATLSSLEKMAEMARSIGEDDAPEIEAIRIVRDELTVAVETVDVDPSLFDNE